MSATAPQLIDTHAHPQAPEFGQDLDAVLERAESAGVIGIVCVGYDLPSSLAAVALAEGRSQLFASVGIHPNSVGRAGEDTWVQVRQLARSPRVVAVGETGLDNYREWMPPDLQEVWLRRHLDLARGLSKPVVIHNREADERAGQILCEWAADSRSSGCPGVLHCFSSNERWMRELTGSGFSISIAGPVTFKNAGPLAAVAGRVPAESLLVETDWPYLTPHPFRGTLEPARMTLTARRLAELRGESFEASASRTTANAISVFRLPLSPIQARPA